MVQKEEKVENFGHKEKEENIRNILIVVMLCFFYDIIKITIIALTDMWNNLALMNVRERNRNIMLILLK